MVQWTPIKHTYPSTIHPQLLTPGGRLVLTCASLYQLPRESGLVEKVERELFGDEEEEVGWKEGESASPLRRPHGAAAFPGWVLDTKPLKKLWARGHKDQRADKLQRAAMPDSLHVFHPVQVLVGRGWVGGCGGG